MPNEAELLAGEVKLSMDQPIAIPLSYFVKGIVREAATVIIQEHFATCPIKVVAAKVDRLEVRFGTMLGLMIGSGTLGGAVVAALVKLIG